MRSMHKVVVVIQRIAKDNLGDDTGKHWRLNLCQPYFMRHCTTNSKQPRTKNPTPLHCIYFKSRRCGGYFTVPESNERSFRAPGATIDLSIETIRCAADGNLTGALFFPRFRYITMEGSIQRRPLETLGSIMHEKSTCAFHISTLVSDFNSDLRETSESRLLR